MATTSNTYTGNGSTKTYSFTFPYLATTDIKIKLTTAAGVDKDITAYTLPSATSITFTALTGSATDWQETTGAPKSGITTLIYRDTDDSKLAATFYPGSAIRAGDLNDNYTQNLYVTQESSNLVADANTTADTAKATADDAADDVKRWIKDGDGTDTAGDEDDADFTARPLKPQGIPYAVAQAAAAVSTANTASTNASNAVTTANSATTTANAATTTANTASTNATNAVNTANAAFQRDGSATMTGNIVFEGSTDDGNETTLAITDPTADRTITIPDRTGTVVTTGDTGTVTSTMITDGTIATADIANSAVTTAKIAADAVDGTKIADDSINSEHYVDGSIDTAHIADSQVTTAKLAADAVTAAKIADDVVNSEHYAAASIDTEHIADANITTAKITDANVTTAKIADNAVTIAKVGCEQTTITDSDSHVPTSGAVVDYVAGQLAPIGGFEAIATEVAFPATASQPASGVIISISDAAGVVVNGSGVSTTGRTTDGTPATVTINNFPSSLYSETLAAGVGLMVSSTGSSNTYNYHKILAAEGDVKQLSDDINDFNARYRVNAGEPGSANDEGDLVFDTNANKMKVYDGSSWGEVTSSGDFKYLFLCPAGGTGAPTLNGSIATYDLREGSNSGSAATVTSAAQLMVSINGVVQKANTGTSAPAEGFALVDSNTIIFGANLASGDSVFIVQFGSALTINTPGDGTVTTAKIASAAVTTAKIADDAVDGAKLANNIDIAGTLDVTGASVFDSTGAFAAKTVVGTTPDWGNATSTGIELNPAAATNWIGIKNSSGSTATNTAFQINHGTTATTSILNNGKGTFKNVIIADRSTSGDGCFQAALNGTVKASITSAGVGTFDSDVKVAGVVWGGTKDGGTTVSSSYAARFYNDSAFPTVWAKNSNGGGLWEGVNSSGNQTSKINSDGSSTFAGDCTWGSFNSSSTSGFGAKIDVTANDVSVLAQCTSTASSVGLHWGGYHGTTRTSHITSGGAAMFAGAVKIGGDADANEMDEYEEGTWTPAFSFSSQSGSFAYTNVSGAYTKVGRLVTATMQLNCSSIPTAGTDLEVTLPIAPIDVIAHTTTDNVGTCIAYYAVASGGSYAIATTGTSGAMIMEQGVDADSGGGYDGMDYDDIESQFSIRATITYHA